MAPDFRFRTRRAAPMTLSPMRIHDATGLSVVGTF
jgi:hypothetical protein